MRTMYMLYRRNGWIAVGCDGVAHVRSAGVLLDTRRGKQRELFAKKGGNTRLYPRPFRRTRFFCAIQHTTPEKHNRKEIPMIRFAANDDMPAICAIRRQVHAVHTAGRPDIFRMPEHAEEFDQSLYETASNEIYRLFVCEADQKITGYALVRIVTVKNICMKCDRLDYFIEEIGVDASCRRCGYGKELMEYVFAEARAHSAASVFLDYWSFNENAARFYENLGMTPKRSVVELTL